MVVKLHPCALGQPHVQGRHNGEGTEIAREAQSSRSLSQEGQKLTPCACETQKGHETKHNDELWDRYGQIPLEAARNALWLAFSLAMTPS